MRCVLTYELPLSSSVIDMPAGAEVLSTRGYRGNIQVAALVDTEQRSVKRRFIVADTGIDVNPTMPFGSKRDFVGTVLIDYFGPALVVHVFDLGEIE